MAALRKFNYNAEPEPYLMFIVEPENKFRFRYESEAGSHGGLAGKKFLDGSYEVPEQPKKGRCKKDDKPFPKVKLVNYKNHADIFVKVTLKTKDHEEHVLELRGKHMKGSLCYEDLDKNFTATFTNLIVRNKKIEEAKNVILQRELKKRSVKGSARVQLETEAKEKAKEIIGSVIICFQAFSHEKPMVPICKPLFSEPITNQKSTLKIHRISLYSGSWRGGDEVILLCDKVKKDKIKVEFYEVAENTEMVIWKAPGIFTKADVHHQVAITFKTPKYIGNVEKTVSLCLRQDDDVSESVQFRYIAEDDDLMEPYRKRKRNTESSSTSVSRDTGNFSDEPSPSPSSHDASLDCMESENEQCAENKQDNIEKEWDFASLLNAGIFEDTHQSQIVSSTSHFLPAFDGSLENEYCHGRIQGETGLSENLGNLSFSGNMNIDPMMPQWGSAEDGCSDLVNYVLEGNTYQVDGVNKKNKAEGYDTVDNRCGAITSSLEKLQLTDDSRSSAADAATDKNQNIGVENDEIKTTNVDSKNQISADISSIPQENMKDTEEILGNHNIKIEISEVQKSNLLTMMHCTKYLRKKDKFGNTPLHSALLQGEESKINDIFKILEKIKSSKFEIINCQNKKKQTALHLATAQNNAKAVKLLVSCNADYSITDNNGNNCVHIAAQKNAVSCLRLFIPVAATQELNAFNYAGLSPLHVAVKESSADCFSLLLTCTDINAKDKTSGRTPLHYAVEIESPTFVEGLLKMPNIDVNAQDFSGDTPLHVASSLGLHEIVEQLLYAGADVLLQNFKKVSELNKNGEDSSDNEDADCSDDEYHSLDTGIDDSTNCQTPLDVSINQNVTELLKRAVDGQLKITSNSVLSNNIISNGDDDKCIEASQQENLFYQGLNECLTESDWKTVVLYLGMDEYAQNTLLDSSNPAEVLINFMKRNSEDSYLDVLKNIFEMVNLTKALTVIQDFCT